MSDRKCAYLTGGSHGIGQRTVIRLAELGYDVAFTYLSSVETAEHTAARARELGVRAFCYQAAMNVPGCAEETALRAIADLGHVDAVINHVGITIFSKEFDDIDVAPMDGLYTADLRTPLVTTRVCAADMIQKGIRGCFVNTSSMHGVRAYTIDALYGGIKAALCEAVRVQARELAPYGIRCNVVAPGAISVRSDSTLAALCGGYGPKIPAGRFGRPLDIADGIAFLVENPRITGQTISVDGGATLPGVPEDGSPEAGYGWSKKRRAWPDDYRARFDAEKRVADMLDPNKSK